LASHSRLDSRRADDEIGAADPLLQILLINGHVFSAALAFHVTVTDKKHRKSTYSGAEGALHAHEVGVSLRFPIDY
jgi:hypothetical protein